MKLSVLLSESSLVINFRLRSCLKCVSFDWMSRLSSSSDDAQLKFLNEWLNNHIQDAQKILRKPVLFTEFGKSSKDPGYSTYQRDMVFETVYSAIYSSARSGGAAVGGMFWQLLTEGMDSFRDGYEVVLSESPSTANLISQQSHKLYVLRKMYARLRNIQKWKRARAIRRAQWLNKNKGKNTGN